jgi:phosphohistidine phosphatase SixA
MRLVILRHGLAVDRTDWAGPDALRPLTPGGRRRARRVVEAVAPLVGRLHAVWTSPWLRAYATAEYAEQAWDAPLVVQPWLAGDASEVAAHIARLPAEDVALVGHEPDLGALIGILTGGPAVPLKKAGLALLAGRPVAGGMRLCLLLTPKAVLGRA